MPPELRSAMHDSMPDGGRCRHFGVGKKSSDADDRFPLAGNGYRLGEQRIFVRILRVEFSCTSLDLIQRSMSDYVIHSTAGIIGEVDSIVSRMHSTGGAGASEARVLDNIDPLAKLAAKR